jgi:hypothetical protein
LFCFAVVILFYTFVLLLLSVLHLCFAVVITKQKGQSKTDNSEKLSALGTQDEDKQNKAPSVFPNVYVLFQSTLLRSMFDLFSFYIYAIGQHWAHKMKINKTKQKGQSKTDNSEKLSALGTQDEDKQNKIEGAIKNRQFRETVSIGHTR